jgi:hypothetical protein
LFIINCRFCSSADAVGADELDELDELDAGADELDASGLSGAGAGADAAADADADANADADAAAAAGAGGGDNTSCFFFTGFETYDTPSLYNTPDNGSSLECGGGGELFTGCVVGILIGIRRLPFPDTSGNGICCCFCILPSITDTLVVTFPFISSLLIIPYYNIYTNTFVLNLLKESISIYHNEPYE